MPTAPQNRLDAWKALGFDPSNCPVRQVLDHVSAKWPTLVMLELRQGPQRFNALFRILPDISKRMLAQSLRDLERDGLVRREVFDTKPPGVSYSLTDMGRSFLARFLTLVEWADENMPAILAARTEFETTAPGQAV
ncbi:winged helix-turn-helix transcriptional regulator [Seohaeicola nanhaiensis]|uniref:Winged helix-turn-helix transcriptional regulator n=1 Tax=Seohaeicola nanhaiensis TaxID=1387282 RepID=A0ABV9KP69_9RHOB